MFINNGPVAAQNKLRAYIVGNGLAAFPEPVRDKIAELNLMAVFNALTEGTEWLYSALHEFGEEMPDREEGLNTLGSLAVGAAEAQLAGKTDRWISIVNWAANELNPLPEGMEAATPEIDSNYSFNQEAVDENLPPMP